MVYLTTYKCNDIALSKENCDLSANKFPRPEKVPLNILGKIYIIPALFTENVHENFPVLT